jgi:PPK2 family polyphosphate:nucleotide phosphotransferase
MNFSKHFRVKPGQRVRLADYDPGATAGFKKDDTVKEHLEKNIARLADLQYRLHAENRRAVLVILQGMDTSGKDGTIRHVMSGLNPQGCRVTSFKVPSVAEASHDFLWRIHQAVPAYSEIGIFNRSHYEEVLVVRVHKLVPRAVWAARYGQINAFEEFLTVNHVTILKFFLHISKAEQTARLRARLEDPEKNWKSSEADFKERQYWPQYVKAYEDVLSRCSTKVAPWFVIPANKKWFRNLAVSQILVETLAAMDPQFPKPVLDPATIKL